MKNKTFIRFALASLVGALSLGAISLLILRGITEGSGMEFRRHTAFVLARIFESYPSIAEAKQHLDEARMDRRIFRTRFWLVSEGGEILASNYSVGLPEPWSRVPRPEHPHDVSVSYRFLGISPWVTVMRIARPEPTFLVMAAPSERGQRREFLETVLFGTTLAFSALLSIFLTFAYLRGKSSEARDVLRRMEAGDLKARFTIKQFDEMGNLMLDFNRMASEIERLVGRLRETELARKTLFQELSHDLRTPLTSLRASVDTLALHWNEMKPEDRSEVLSVCQAEIDYFMELLENLLFIAEIDEPHYKSEMGRVVVWEMMDSEVRVRQAQELTSDRKVAWECVFPADPDRLELAGDASLIRRLLKNVLENAARFASTFVRVSLISEPNWLVVRVDDDGPGMSAEEIAMFGKSRSRRSVGEKFEKNRLGPHVSLGLGSFIMVKIAELHKGKLTVISPRENGSGTRIEIRLPRLIGS